MVYVNQSSSFEHPERHTIGFQRNERRLGVLGRQRERVQGVQAGVFFRVERLAVQRDPFGSPFVGQAGNPLFKSTPTLTIRASSPASVRTALPAAPTTNTAQ